MAGQVELNFVMEAALCQGYIILEEGLGLLKIVNTSPTILPQTMDFSFFVTLQALSKDNVTIEAVDDGEH